MDEADDLISTIERHVQDRRFGTVVRLEVAHNMPSDVCNILLRNLTLTNEDVRRVKGPLDLSSLHELYRQPYPELKDAPLAAHTPAAFETEASIFSAKFAKAIFCCTIRMTRLRRWSILLRLRLTTRMCWPSSRRSTGLAKIHPSSRR